MSSSTILPPELKSLTPKQRTFVMEYAKERNGTKAAHIAGYKGSKKYLGMQASRLIGNDRVSHAIAALAAPALQDAQVTVEKVLNKLAYFAFSPIEFDSKGKIKIPVKDQISALKALGEHLGLFESSRRPEQKPEHLALIEGADNARRLVDAIIRRATK